MKNDAINTICVRIKELVDFFSKGNNSNFAKLVGTSEANVRNYKSKTLPKADFLIKTVQNLEINCEWLLLGRGEMLRNNEKEYPNQYIRGNNNQQIGKGSEINTNNIEQLISMINNLTKQVESKDKMIETLMKQQENLINQIDKLTSKYTNDE